MRYGYRRNRYYEALEEEDSLNYDFLQAVFDGDLNTVIELLEAGADIDFQDPSEHGATALMLAAEENEEDIVELLLKLGADVNETNWYDQTALDLAGSLTIGKLISDAGGKSGYQLNPSLDDPRFDLYR